MNVYICNIKIPVGSIEASIHYNKDINSINAIDIGYKYLKNIGYGVYYTEESYISNQFEYMNCYGDRVIVSILEDTHSILLSKKFDSRQEQIAQRTTWLNELFLKLHRYFNNRYSTISDNIHNCNMLLIELFKKIFKILLPSIERDYIMLDLYTTDYDIVHDEKIYIRFEYSYDISFMHISFFNNSLYSRQYIYNAINFIESIILNKCRDIGDDTSISIKLPLNNKPSINDEVSYEDYILLEPKIKEYLNMNNDELELLLKLS